MKAGVRLSGGRWRGRRLPAPAGVRPTEGRVREALASIWTPVLDGARILDLFAGSGAVGLEMVSRGAGAATLVDRAPAVLSALRRSLRELDAEDRVSVRRLDLPRGAGKLEGAVFDLIFADPPYAFEDYAGLLAAVAPVAAEDAEAVVEHAASRVLDEVASGWRAVDRRRYGDCALTFFRRLSTAPDSIAAD